MGLSDHLSWSRFLTLHTSALKMFFWNTGIHLWDYMVPKPRSQPEQPLPWNLKTHQLHLQVQRISQAID
jgi:hypothetical protein